MFNILKKHKKVETQREIPSSEQIRDIKIYNDLLYQGRIYSDFFNREIEVIFDLDVDIKYVEKCINHFNNLNSDIKNTLYNSFINYCNKTYEEYTDIERIVPEDISGADILQFISDGELIIEKGKDESIGYHIEANCVWEEEHGLEFTIINDRVIYVGEFADISPWSKIENLDKKWNYKI